MTTQLRPDRSGTIPRRSASARPAASDRPGRLIRVALALYLVPALAVVLAVGALGLLVLAAARLFGGPRGLTPPA